jgi:hypothetical protein
VLKNDVTTSESGHKGRAKKDAPTFLLTQYELTPCANSPPSKAHNSSASEEILSILWKPNVHYLIRNSPPPVRILSHIHPGRPLPSCSFTEWQVAAATVTTRK